MNRNAYTVLVRNPEERTPLRRPRLIGIILKWKLEIGWEAVDWINLAEDTNMCQAVVKVSRNFGFRRVHKIAKSDYEVRHVCPSVRPSVLLEQLGSNWMIFIKFDV